MILHIEDSQSKTSEGVTTAKKLLDTKNIDVIVSLQSAVVIPLLSLADQHDIPLVATAISQDEFTQKSKNAFRLFPPAGQDAALAAEFANKKGFKEASTLTILDEYGVSMKEHFKKNFKGEIVHEESFEVSDKDFRTTLMKIAASDAVYFIGYPPHYANLLKQREELGKNTTLVSNLIMTSKIIQSEVGDLLTNLYATIPASVLISEKSKDFIEEYEKKYKQQSDWAAPFGYDMILVLDAVDKNIKQSRNKPIDALHEIEVEGLNGLISFDEVGEAYIPQIVVEAKEGLLKRLE